MKHIALLGATGSIGTNTLDVVRAYPDRFRIVALAGGHRVEPLVEAAREFRPEVVALADGAGEDRLKDALADLPCCVLAGVDGVLRCIAESGADLCVSAAVGSAGLRPTLAAIDAGMDIALANKEVLVAAGALVRKRVAKKGVRLLPVDSEHSALFQCLEGRDPASVQRLILTASGGPFRGQSREALARVTPADALDHPNWDMGAKVTIDSATLANKALEVIEAHWLFDVPYDRIDVVVHPQSLVHSFVEFKDGSLLAQLASCDMRVPIQYALSWPERLAAPSPSPDLTAVGTLTFESPDRDAFPLLGLGYEAGRRGGVAPAVFSAANEEAVSRFLAGTLSFLSIADVVRGALERVEDVDAPNLEDILRAENEARHHVIAFSA